MDKFVEHAIRMLEIVEGENDFYRNDAKRQADIARAVYDTILRVQALERKADRKTEPQTDWETEKRDNSLCYKCVKECDRRVLNRYTIECNQYEPKDEQSGKE